MVIFHLKPKESNVFVIKKFILKALLEKYFITSYDIPSLIFSNLVADVIPAKRKRKIITPAESKTVTYTENTAPKPSEQTVSPAKRTEHEST